MDNGGVLEFIRKKLNDVMNLNGLYQIPNNNGVYDIE